MPETLSVQCCIAGGGPAGMTLGLLLARAGVSVLVLEKHADFLRDFRGDTLHPSTLEIMHELEVLERFLQLPHQKYLGSMHGLGIWNSRWRTSHIYRLSAAMLPSCRSGTFSTVFWR